MLVGACLKLDGALADCGGTLDEVGCLGGDSARGRAVVVEDAKGHHEGWVGGVGCSSAHDGVRRFIEVGGECFGEDGLHAEQIDQLIDEERHDQKEDEGGHKAGAEGPLFILPVRCPKAVEGNLTYSVITWWQHGREPISIF